ncbi:MAG: ABC transporter [Verrucomicrobia bacterium]|nr:MAG: ABC transporter [Verrucomicrobiota bacterium]
MKRLLYELSESWKIAAAQMRSNLTRSTLTALGVIIGIIAVTLMGTAVNGISIGFDKSMAVLGDDVLYVTQWPWKPVDDWWNYRDRKKIKTDYTETLNRMIAATPNSNLVIAVPTSNLMRSIKYGGNQVDNVFVLGTTSDFIVIGLFSWDSMVAMPLGAFNKYFSAKSDSDVRVKVKDKTRLADAKDELTGLMRRVRGLPPEKKDDFSINEQQAFKSTLDPVKNSIAIAGLFITGLSLFVGAIGIMNITFVSVKERTKEIGTRKALGARRRTILLQFLIESTALCLLGGFIGLAFAYLMCFGIGKAFPSFPIHFSVGLVFLSMIVSILTGLFSGFAPAWTASRLDPVAALRYE